MFCTRKMPIGSSRTTALSIADRVSALCSVPTGATNWESDNQYPWLKNDFPLQKLELDKNLTDFANKFIEKQGQEDVAQQDQLLNKLTDKESYVPASKYSVSALYYKVWQLEREVYYILNCLKTVRSCRQDLFLPSSHSSLDTHLR